jgi:IS4 transposase
VARGKSIGIRKQLTSIISTRRLKAIAAKAGVVQRKRKVEVPGLFWTIVLGFGAGVERSIAGLRRAYAKSTGVTMSRSGFHKRFTLPLLAFFKEVVTGMIGALVKLEGTGDRLKGALGLFKDVLITDSTLVKLNDLLEKNFPGTRTNSAKASAKLHMILSVRAQGPESVKITSGRQHDRPVLKVGPWVAGKLVLFDLGYYDFRLFDRIDEYDGYFVSRLKENANPRIVTALRQWRGQSVPIVGEKLRDVAGRLKRSVLDVEVEVAVKRRTYRGHQSRDTRRFRLVGLYDEDAKTYHFYLTNIPPETLAAEQLGRVYEARWLVELVWKEMKSYYHLEDIPSKKSHIVETLLLATVVTLIVSRRLLRAVRSALGDGAADGVPEQRWAALFAGVASEVLGLLLLPAQLARGLAPRLERMLLAEAADPNVGRRLLLARVTNGATC